MVHVHTIKSTIYIVIGTPPKILDISSNLVFWFLDAPGFDISRSLNITLFGVPFFSVSAVLGSTSSSFLDCCKDRIFSLSNLHKQIVCEIILASLESDLDHYFVAAVLLYFSVAFLMKSGARIMILYPNNIYFFQWKDLRLSLAPTIDPWRDGKHNPNSDIIYQ